MHWIPVVVPSIFKLANKFDKITKLSDLSTIAIQTKDSNLAFFLGRLIKGSTDPEWRNQVELIARQFGGKEQVFIEQMLAAPPAELMPNFFIEEMLPSLRAQEKDLLKSNAVDTLSQFIKDLLNKNTGKDSVFNEYLDNKASNSQESLKKLLSSPHLRGLIDLGGFEKLEISNAQQTGNLIIVSGLIYGSSDKKKFEAILGKTASKLRVNSLDIK
jgi:hypothetical protein